MFIKNNAKSSISISYIDIELSQFNYYSFHSDKVTRDPYPIKIKECSCIKYTFTGVDSIEEYYISRIDSFIESCSKKVSYSIIEYDCIIQNKNTIECYEGKMNYCIVINEDRSVDVGVFDNPNILVIKIPIFIKDINVLLDVTNRLVNIKNSTGAFIVYVN